MHNMHNMHNMHHVFQYQYYHTRLCLNLPAECEWLLTSCEIFSTFVKFSSHKCPLRCIVNLCRVPIIACDTLWHMQPHERQMFSSGFSNHHNYIIMISNQILISPQCSHFWERSLLFWLLHLYKIPFSLFSFYKVLKGKVCILASLSTSLQVVCISLFLHLCAFVRLCICLLWPIVNFYPNLFFTRIPWPIGFYQGISVIAVRFCSNSSFSLSQFICPVKNYIFQYASRSLCLSRFGVMLR